MSKYTPKFNGSLPMILDIEEAYSRWEDTPYAALGQLKNLARDVFRYNKPHDPHERSACAKALDKIAQELDQKQKEDHPTFQNQPKLLWYVALILTQSGYHQESLNIISRLEHMDLEDFQIAPERMKLENKKDEILSIIQDYAETMVPDTPSTSTKTLEYLNKNWVRNPSQNINLLATYAQKVFDGEPTETQGENAQLRNDRDTLKAIAAKFNRLQSMDNSIFDYQPKLLQPVKTIIDQAQNGVPPSPQAEA